MTNADYVDDQALLANTPAQPKSLLYCQKQAAGGIGIYMQIKLSICVLNKKASSTF